MRFDSPATTVAVQRVINDTWGELSRLTFDELCRTT